MSFEAAEIKVLSKVGVIIERQELPDVGHSETEHATSALVIGL